MMSAPAAVPLDGTALVLSEAARRHGRRYSREHVRALVERHSQPSSLLALVEVAPTLGLRPTAGQGDLEALDDTAPEELPAILHFSDGGEQGFGLLEAVLPRGQGFRVWDSRAGSRVLGREALASRWTGVVVFLERDGAGLPERDAWPRLAREWLLETWRPRTHLAGPGGSPGVRWGLGVMLAVLVGLAVAAQPAELRWLAAAVAGLTALGLAAALTATAWARGTKATGLCGGGGPLDCDSVLLSPWASVGGIPLGGLGVAFFGASLLLQGTAALTGSPAPLWLAAAAFVPALPLSLVLVGVQVRMRRFCTLCMTVHAVDVAGAALFVLGVWRALPVPPPGWGAAALLGLVSFTVLLSTAVPFLSARGEDAEELAREHVRLLRSPLATLARLMAEPARPVDGVGSGALLGQADAPHTLVVLAHPTCHLCGPALDELEALLARYPGTLRAFLCVSPRDPGDARDAALCEALAAVGVAHGGQAFLQLFRAAKQDLKGLMDAARPLERLATASGLDLEALERAREAARERVRRAGEARAHARGLPAFFLDGRRCEAPLSHVETWCARPELLAMLGPTEAAARASPEAPDAARARDEDSHPSRWEGTEAP